MLRNRLEENMCLYRPNAWWEGEFEWINTLQGPQLENCRKEWSLRVRNPLKQFSNSLYITTCCLGGFQENIILARPKTNSSIFSNQTRLELNGDWILWSNETKTMSFLAANTQDGFGEHRDKKYPMCTMKSTAVFLMLGAFIYAGGPGHLV